MIVLFHHAQTSVTADDVFVRPSGFKVVVGSCQQVGHILRLNCNVIEIAVVIAVGGAKQCPAVPGNQEKYPAIRLGSQQQCLLRQHGGHDQVHALG